MSLVILVDELIAKEVNMYVVYCRKAAEHDEHEHLYRQLAHAIFYHIEEMRTTGRPSFIKSFTKPPIP